MNFILNSSTYMKFIWILIVLLCCNFGKADYSCYAPPLLYGPACNSSERLISGCCTQIIYSVEVIGDVNVFCEALGTGIPTIGSNCTFGWYDIGIVNDVSVSLGWSSSAGTPGIKCYGSPLGSALTWSWTTKASNILCPLYCKGNPCLDSTCICSENGSNTDRIISDDSLFSTQA